MPTALVTGATSGIGLAFARALADERHDLVLVARHRERLDEVAADLRSRGASRCEVITADLADPADCAAVEARLAEGRVDLLVNNAGFALGAPFDTTDVEAEQRSLDVLVGAVMRLSHAALGPMLARGAGDIVNVSSVAGFLPQGTYGASKAWVTSFSAWANVHYRRRGVRVLALCPGLVHTNFHQAAGGRTPRAPRWMWLEPDEVVQQALGDLRAGRAVSIPSQRYRLLIRAARFAPRGLVERIGRWR